MEDERTQAEIETGRLGATVGFTGRPGGDSAAGPASVGFRVAPGRGGRVQDRERVVRQDRVQGCKPE